MCSIEASLPGRVLAVAGCVVVAPPAEIAPFADRPNEILAIADTVVTVDGAVWSFERSGAFVNYHGPFGIIWEGEQVRAIAIVGTGIDLRTGADVMRADPEEIRQLIAAAERYCAAHGYEVRRVGAGIHTQGDTMFLTEFCTPEGR